MTWIFIDVGISSSSDVSQGAGENDQVSYTQGKKPDHCTGVLEVLEASNNECPVEKFSSRV